ncbi:MAG: ATP-binding protein [Sandaracinus sp.]
MATDPQDVVGNRRQLLEIGMLAVFGACVVFGALRLVTELVTGLATPWWGNLGGAVLIGALHLWYRRAPEARSTVAVHGTALVATIALVIPAAYDMPSSKWWLSLVGFSVLLMGRRTEAIVWTAITIALVPLVAWLEPYVVVPNAVGESTAERTFAGLGYVLILLSITRAFRRVAAARARELSETARSLERANAVRSRFLAHMSHELRTPLHGVIAMTDLARRGEASTAVREQVTAAQESAHVLLGLLNNVLDFTRAEADAIALDARPFALDEALADVLRPFVVQAEARGIALAAQAERGIVARRVGDRVRLVQIVLNLVANALKFTPTGRVTLRVKAAADPDRVILEVEDTGRGIPEEKLATVFEPFQQGAREDAAIQGGVGLGLAIVRELVKRMHGNIALKSTVGVGTTFTVEVALPRAPGATTTLAPDLLAVRERKASGPLAGTSALSILVCDDEPFSRRILDKMLSNTGHRVTLAEDGQAAWELLAEREFDLLLTDVEMPRLNGLELARLVRAREAREGRPRLPILAATAHVGEDEQHQVLGAGIDVHLPKPFTQASLMRALERAMQRRASDATG